MRVAPLLLGMAVGVLLAGSAAAEGLARWRTPSGGLYVGDNPPPGSTFAGRAGTLETVGDGWVPAEDDAPSTASSSSPPLTDAQKAELDRHLKAKWRCMTDTLAGNPQAGCENLNRPFP